MGGLKPVVRNFYEVLKERGPKGSSSTSNVKKNPSRESGGKREKQSGVHFLTLPGGVCKAEELVQWLSGGSLKHSICQQQQRKGGWTTLQRLWMSGAYSSRLKIRGELKTRQPAGVK